jgi:steroid delta-isomerase-like uncharacterized protein
MSEENKAFVKNCLEELWNKGNLTASEDFFSKTVNYVDPVLPETRGVEAVKQVITMVRTAFPNFHLTFGDLIAEGDKVVIRYTGRGTHKSEFLGIGATGKQFETTGTTTCRLAGGKIVEMWLNWDALGSMRQLGVVSLPK